MALRATEDAVGALSARLTVSFGQVAGMGAYSTGARSRPALAGLGWLHREITHTAGPPAMAS